MVNELPPMSNINQQQPKLLEIKKPQAPKFATESSKEVLAQRRMPPSKPPSLIPLNENKNVHEQEKAHKTALEENDEEFYEAQEFAISSEPIHNQFQVLDEVELHTYTGEIIGKKEFVRQLKDCNDTTNFLIVSFLDAIDRNYQSFDIFNLPLDLDYVPWVMINLPNTCMPTVQRALSHLVPDAGGKFHFAFSFHKTGNAVPVHVGATHSQFIVSAYSLKDLRNTIATHKAARPGQLLLVDVASMRDLQKQHNELSIEHKKIQNELKLNEEKHQAEVRLHEEKAAHRVKQCKAIKMDDEEIQCFERAIIKSDTIVPYSLVPGTPSNLFLTKNTVLNILNRHKEKLTLQDSMGRIYVLTEDLIEIVTEYRPSDTCWVQHYSISRTTLNMWSEKRYSHKAMQQMLANSSTVQHFVSFNGNFMELQNIPPGAPTEQVYTINPSSAASTMLTLPLSSAFNLMNKVLQMGKVSSPADLTSESSRWSRIVDIAGEYKFVPSSISKTKQLLSEHHCYSCVMEIITTHGEIVMRAHRRRTKFWFSYDLLLAAMNDAPLFINYDDMKSYIMTAIIKYNNDYAPIQDLGKELTIAQGTELLLRHCLARSLQVETGESLGFSRGLLRL